MMICCSAWQTWPLPVHPIFQPRNPSVHAFPEHIALQRGFKAMAGALDFMDFARYMLLSQFVIQAYALIVKRVILGNFNIGGRKALP